MEEGREEEKGKGGGDGRGGEGKERDGGERRGGAGRGVKTY